MSDDNKTVVLDENQSSKIEPSKRAEKRAQLKANNKKSKKWILLVVALLIVCGIGAFFVYQYQMKEKARALMAQPGIYTGITIDGVDVSGMSIEDAIVKLKNEDGKDASQKTLTFVYMDEETWEVPFASLGANFAVEEAVQEAYDYGRSGTEKERMDMVTGLLKHPIDIPVAYTVDEMKAKEEITTFAEEFKQEVEDSEITLVGGKFQVTQEVLGRELNVEATLAEALVGLQTMANAEVQVVAEVTTPTLTYAENSKVKDLIGTFTTTYTSSDVNRNTNLVVGCKNINGTVVAPDEVFSATEGLGEQTYERGYRNAGVYVNGKVESGMGGGVCQITTTLYNAVIFAELEIVERHGHSMTVGYVPLGRDAAIADYYKDLRIKNNTGAPIYIEAYASNGKLVVNIYGVELHETGRKLEFETVVETTVPKPAEIVKEDPEKEEGTRVVTSKGRTGSKVSVYKKIYQNGELLSREFFTSTSYRAVADEVTVGTKPVTTTTTPDTSETNTNTNVQTDVSAEIPTDIGTPSW